MTARSVGGRDYRTSEQRPPAPAPVDTSAWNTKGYAAPTSAATSSYAAPGGWDQTKWADQNYQDPKYVVGRLEMQASGGDGTFDTPQEKQAAVDAILKAYPGAKFNGKDMLDFGDGGAPVDIFRRRRHWPAGMSFAPQIPGDGGQGGQASSGGGGFSAAMGQNAVAAAQAAGGGRQVGGGNYLPADFQYEKFDPNSVDMSKDPGVAFRISEAQKAMQNSAASKGTLFSGGFAKALEDRTQDYASQEYGNAFQRALGVNQANNQGGLATYQRGQSARISGRAISILGSLEPGTITRSASVSSRSGTKPLIRISILATGMPTSARGASTTLTRSGTVSLASGGRITGSTRTIRTSIRVTSCRRWVRTARRNPARMAQPTATRPAGI
jgi:hypothetical protein